ncbi:hypothetical protein RN001_012491 [Aquatica leii]|uniref:Arginine kinase n=1 Tax=Aquatica leii TaxID=1421715 RepID=A0AAN7P350_9COLE|nr:hypothetical protein RN001_012491 [Aquatica leii]
MPELRRRLRSNPDYFVQSDGLYVHANPPRALQITSAYVKQLIRNGDIEKLHNLVVEGQGKRLIGGYSADYKTRTFLKSVPSIMTKINLLHDAVNSGRLEELQNLLEEEPDRKRLILAKDDAGVGLLHKAVYYNLTDIVKWIVTNYPQAVTIKDADGRTPCHYTPVCKDPAYMQKLLVGAGGDLSALDNRQRSTKYYMAHASELELPSLHKAIKSPRKSTPCSEGLVIKKSNIRIWIHHRDLGHLQKVVWEGHGSKLLVEHSTNSKVKKFFDAVPHIMGLIKDIHTDIQNDDLDSLQTHTSPPILPVVLSAKDSNGLTPLHKAAGLGRYDIAKYIVETYPDSVNSLDNDGRSPLHFSTLAKDNGQMFDFLIESGANESLLDNKQKTAAYYKNRNSEIDGKLLLVIPECPRTAKDGFASNFDWSMLSNSEIIAKPIKVEEDCEEKQNTEVPENETKEDVIENTVIDDAVEVVAVETPVEVDVEIETQADAEAPVEEVVQNGDVENVDEPETEILELVEENTVVANKDEVEVVPELEDIADGNIVDELVIEDPTTPTNEIMDNIVEDSVDNKVLETNENENVEEKVVEKEAELLKSVVEAEGVIEGVVNGENEIESVNEQGQGVDDKEDDPEVVALIEEGNMEVLAALVLNGDGDKLVGYRSENPELQAFLDNVPTYMSKINKIHAAARDGSLRDLQAALDRRKFAIAKDHISPNGTSPLHVATIFGNTSIVRYLAGRFPETVLAVDDNGRTPLHYAATLDDNGHYYNLLVHLGADSRAEDKFGNTADYYRSNQGELSHRSLLLEFGAEETVADIVNDKVPDDTCSARKDLDDPDMLAVLERCYNLLHGRRNSIAISAASHLTSISDVSNSSVSSKHLKRYVFDNVKLRITKLDHNFYDIIWPSVKKLPQEREFRMAVEKDFPLGIIVPDFYSYQVFHEYLEPVIKDANLISLTSELSDHPATKFFEDEYKLKDFDFDLDPNLNNFNLPKSLNVSELEEVERVLTSVLLDPETAKALYPNASAQDIKERGSGNYYTMNEVLEDPSEVRVVLAANGLLIPLWDIPESDRLHGKHWPYGRGVFVSSSGNLAAWINVLDHLRIVTCTSAQKPANIGQIYFRIYRLLSALEKTAEFKKDKKLGYLTARPTSLGNTLHFSLTVRFPYLIKEPDNLRHLCTTRNLTYYKCDNSSDAVRIGNKQSVGLTELQTFEDFTTAVSNILQLEKDLAMSNSLHIAALFVNIFRRKKAGMLNASKVHVDMPFFYTEEGRYLASSLGDPLIKGLTEVANKRPDDPIAYLATYLYNFANNDRSRVKTQEIEEVITGPPEDIDNNNAVPTTIEVVTVEPDSDNSNEEESAFNKTSRDEHGQSMLHFAAARSHGRNALFQLLLETEMNISYRDELYRTARDIMELLMNGYDHITDVVDEDDIPIVEAVSSKGQADTVTFLQSILTFEEKRERVHHAIRQGASGEVFSLLADEKDTGSGKLLAIGKNSYGRCALHIAVLCQQEEIVDYLVNTFPETLHIGDNLERTALHYSMGVEKMETINKLLIHGGAKRVAKDLKGRQPTYYFMNKSDILRLQEEEETF